MLVWLAPLVVLGLVVFVHELGHFLAAKAVGVYAPRFSLGWGSPVFRWRRKGAETEYVISWLPIGGYVRMASRLDESAAILEGGPEKVAAGAERDPHWDPDAMVPHGPRPVPSDRWFESKPTWARVVILLAGVTMNALLTLVVATGVYATYGRRDPPAVMDSVVAGKPAERAGFQRGDSITAINGVGVGSWSDLLARVSASPGQLLRFDVVRGAGRVTLVVTPEPQVVANVLTGKAERVGRIGAGPVNRFIRHPVSLGESVRSGWRATWQMGGAVIGVLGGLVQGTVSVKTLGGPIAIVGASVDAAKSGVESLFALIAFLSINLAVLNLLPIPILDGGQILITMAEGVKGRPFSDRTRDGLMKIGIALIAALFLVVMFNDLKALALRIF
ncbi:MAG TPA: RIP metalloprotease RseP [Gemmatimonadaceae bacterium]|nr:RIP metalloprotease RseP [Gemmatimonadaceae bacterium]